MKQEMPDSVHPNTEKMMYFIALSLLLGFFSPFDKA